MSSPKFFWDIEQGSDEWLALKAGCWSASNAAVIMGGLDTKGLADYIMEIAWERVYGPIGGKFKSDAMRRGNEVEPEARDWYSFDKGESIDTVGCVMHADIPNVLWSPDGLVGANGAVEIKCPLHKAYMEVVRTRAIPSEYRWQTKWGMWVGQRDWMDFVVYHPQASGLVIPCEVTAEEKERMAERVDALEPKVAKWVEILGNAA